MIDRSIIDAGGVFVTGTDTGVGKTWVTALLVKSFLAQGLSTAVLKPVETGVEGDATDLSFISHSSGLGNDLVRCTYEFKEPLAPAVVARLEGKPISLARIVEDFKFLKSMASVVIVEGAGGILVPLNEDLSMAGLAKELGIPVVIVATAELGMLNHSALTAAACRAQGLDVVGLVVNFFPTNPTLAERTNPSEVERVADAELIGLVPTISPAGNELPENVDCADCLSPQLGGRFDRAKFLRAQNPSESVSC